MPVTTNIDKFRLELGDTPAAYDLPSPRPTPDPQFEAAALFNDDEVTYFLTAHPGNVLLAVAAACDALAARFARDVDVTEDRQQFQASQMSLRYEQMAARFRARAAIEVAGQVSAYGVPLGRVPVRTATSWQERY